MKIRFEESFEKDLRRIKDKKIKSSVRQIIDEVKASNTQQQIRNLEKLTNYKT